MSGDTLKIQDARGTQLSLDLDLRWWRLPPQTRISFRELKNYRPDPVPDCAWPECGYAAVDVFSCGVSLRHMQIHDELQTALGRRVGRRARFCPRFATGSSEDVNGPARLCGREKER